jgi:hopanoid biosynthesis associated radical SAM protein HpnH
MPVPLSQIWTVASYVLGKKLRGVERYPLVLMLEPLFRCNLACAGCGKIQYPAETLRRHLTPQQCFDAVDECGAPMVSIPGGEPLLHPQIEEIVAGLVARRKYVYLCTNAILLEKHLDKFTPSKYLSFSVHIDGLQDEHDEAVCREGVFDVAVSAIRAAVARGFRVTTNTTLFNNADPERVRAMFDALMELGVEGMMVSPGYPYEKAPDQEHFLHRNETRSLFRRILAPQQQAANGGGGIANCKLGIANCKLGLLTNLRFALRNLQFAFRNLQFAISRAATTHQKRKWRFNQSPLFLEFLRGNFELECTPWGNPTYNLFGWQQPCYLLNEGYAATFHELMESTDWSAYGCASGNPKCTDCMVHSGYEPSAVQATFGSLQGLITAARVSVFGPGKSDDPPSLPIRAPHRPRRREPDVVPLETSLRSA